jgi:hypothetical protein
MALTSRAKSKILSLKKSPNQRYNKKSSDGEESSKSKFTNKNDTAIESNNVQKLKYALSHANRKSKTRSRSKKIT